MKGKSTLAMGLMQDKLKKIKVLVDIVKQCDLVFKYGQIILVLV